MQAARGTALTLPGSAARPARRRVGLLLAIAGTVYALDVISKVVVVATLSHHQPVRLLGGLLTLLVLRNSGAAFSIGTSMTIVFTVIAVGVIFFILRTSRRLGSAVWAVTLGLLLGGATGNLTDRVLRSPGALRGDVVDWIQLPHWPVFNLADSAIVCGGVLAVLLATRGIHLDGSRDGGLLTTSGGSGDGGADSGGEGGDAEDPGRSGGAADNGGGAGRPAADSGEGDHRGAAGSGHGERGGAGSGSGDRRAGDGGS